MTDLRAELTQHVEVIPLPYTGSLSNAPCGSLRLAQLDRKIATGKNFTEVDSNTYSPEQ